VSWLPPRREVTASLIAELAVALILVAAAALWSVIKVMDGATRLNVGVLVLFIVALALDVYAVVSTRRMQRELREERAKAQAPSKRSKSNASLHSARHHQVATVLSAQEVVGRIKSSPDYDQLMDLLRKGEEIKRRLIDNVSSVAAVREIPTGEGDVAQWEQSVCSALRAEPRMVAQFMQALPQSLDSVEMYHAMARPLHSRMEYRLSHLDRILKDHL
jgi:hypothetical protein